MDQTDCRLQDISDEEPSTDATMAMIVPPFSGIDPRELDDVLNRSHPGAFSKPESDFAFAALLIRSRQVSERRLRQMLKTWTSFGDISLHAYLQQQRLIPEEKLAKIEAETVLLLRSIEESHSWDECRWDPAKRTSWFLEQIDPNSRIAKIFGLSGMPRSIVGNEDRSFTSRFRLIRKLGQGGLGTVWLAVDTSLHRYVAVKEIVSDGRLNPNAMIRFRREAEITGRLEHASIVPMYLLGENEADGRLFYVMRYLGNRTLEDAIREYHERRERGKDDPLEFHHLLMAFVSVCQAIAYAHSRKVIHRDLKPQNIALDYFGQVIVLDWGLARTLGLENPETSSLRDATRSSHDELEATIAGQVMGTPMYMAPEQAAGRVDDIDEQTDVYGLGAILYAILTGYAPHEQSSETLGAGSRMSALLAAIVEGQATSPRRLNRQVPPKLDAICLKALAAEQHDRYVSAAALSDDLQRWMADEPISALSESTAKRLRRWTIRHPRWTQAAAALCTLGLAAGVTAGVASYESYVVANQVELQTCSDSCRDLKRTLTATIESLSEDARFMSSVPPIAGLLDDATGKPDITGTERLKAIYRGLLNANPHYVAVTFWRQKQLEETQNPVRVENQGSQRDLQRRDISAYFEEHLSAITNLPNGEVYIGVPGRAGPPLSPGVSKTSGDSTSAISSRNVDSLSVCVVAGISIFDHADSQGLGGVAIECDLERILRKHLEISPSRSRTIYLTDNDGRCAMRFTGESGLRLIATTHPAPFDDPMLDAYFANPEATDVYSVNRRLFAAKIPLSQHRPERFMGLIVELEE